MQSLYQIIFGLTTGYLSATLSESTFHRLIGHASPSHQRAWRRIPDRFSPFVLSHFRHGIIHHHLTFKSNFVTKFADCQEKDRVTALALRKGDTDIAADHCDFGLTIGWRGFFYFNLLTLPFLPVIFLLMGPFCALGYALMLVVTPSLSRWIHPYLHQDLRKTGDNAPSALRFLFESGYFRSVRRHHYLHHKYLDCNFNLLLGGDWILGVHRCPTPSDLDEMNNIGIRLD
jgi:hypothetical protein